MTHLHGVAEEGALLAVGEAVDAAEDGGEQLCELVAIGAVEGLRQESVGKIALERGGGGAEGVEEGLDGEVNAGAAGQPRAEVREDLHSLRPARAWR